MTVRVKYDKQKYRQDFKRYVMSSLLVSLFKESGTRLSTLINGIEEIKVPIKY